MSTNILTDAQLHARYIGCFAAGLAIALLAYAAPRWINPEAAVSDAPKVLVQTQSQTVARIPTLHAGVRVDCTVTIDQAKNVWSITC